MAQVVLPTLSASLSIIKNADQFLRVGPVKDFTGAVVDLSAWNAIELHAFASDNTTTNDDSGALGTCTGDAAGNITIALTTASGAEPTRSGQGRFKIMGKVLVGDALQCLASGQYNYSTPG